ncbi:MAG: PIN domain-containing protein [Terriglobia bacterium]|jgi:predicted nucleic acid-binding protein
MTSYSLDTDTITKLLKKHPGNQRVLDRFRKEVRNNSLFIMCPVVFYEIRRELVIKNAGEQLSAFEKMAEAMVWKEFNSAIWERASSLWATLRSRGRSHHDADVLIAAHAVEYATTIVTGNVEHFQDIGAWVEDWNQ